jgi:hypothetical protein
LDAAVAREQDNMREFDPDYPAPTAAELDTRRRYIRAEVLNRLWWARANARRTYRTQCGNRQPPRLLPELSQADGFPEAYAPGPEPPSRL